ncbi:MAG: beta-lactamase family protein [Roseivirga sp.]|nr:beta-lactamase family protein [Roseivirga sp.]
MKVLLLRSFICISLITGSCFTVWSQDLTLNEKAQIDSLFNEYTELPGAAVGVFRNGKIIFKKGYGLANLDYNIPVTTKTVFETGLASTQFTAACIVLLENQGKLDLDDTIQKFIPEFPRYQEGDITIRQLLLHTSGLRDYIRIFFAQGKSWNQDFDEHRALELMMAQDGLAFAPGTRFAPGDSSYSLLASIVRSITGMSIGAFAQKELFGPLGMKDSFIYEDLGKIVPNRAIGYSDEGNGYEMHHYFNFVGGGNRRVYSTINDFFLWSENLKKNSIGNDTFIDQLTTRGTLSNGSPISSGLGLDNGIFMGQALVGYGGHWAGSASMYLKFPDVDLSVVVLSNNGTINAAGKAYDLAAIFLEPQQPESVSEAGPAPTPQTIELPQEQLEAFASDYFNYESGYVRRILVENGKLIYSRLDAGTSRLSPIGDHTFIMDNIPYSIKMDFRNNDQGLPCMYVQVDDEPESEYVRTVKPSYTEQEFKAFEGDYYAPTLDVTYTLKVVDGNLESRIGRHSFLTWNPVLPDLFNEAHFGYLLFEKNDKGEYTGFTMNNALGEVRFEKR